MEVWIVDFGSQYTQLIVRQSRELGYRAIILTLPEVRRKIAAGISPLALVLSGGPQSLEEDRNDYSFLFQNPCLPVLGICYGMQVMGGFFGGKVVRGQGGEYGEARLHFSSSHHHISQVPPEFKVWMSHGDHLESCPPGFHSFLESENGLIAAIISQERPLVGLQFHPEVKHSHYGKQIIEYFYRDVACLERNWKLGEIREECEKHIVDLLGEQGSILCAFSGGVDSLVAACLAHEKVGERLHCFFVDHGLLRPQDLRHMEELKSKTPLKITILKSQELFFKRLEAVGDPEEKRKIIGATFIEVFDREVHNYEKKFGIHFTHLLQGTLYPDVIESVSPHGKQGASATIKSHHNVGGLPAKMKLQLLEPFRFLFKDEVRRIGLNMGLPDKWVFRHPFPGPGIGIRILGEVSQERVEKVQVSDQIFYEELQAQGQYEHCWQAFTVLLPIKTVGVKGDKRAYEEVICLRAVNSDDGMTSTWTELPPSFLAKVSNRITNEIPGITRVVYDITSKPPGTIEWE